MMARILMRGYKDPLRVVSPEATLDRDILGGNSGNLLFSQAAFRMLSTPETEIKVSNFLNLFDKPDRINANYDAVVLPFANAFRPAFLPLLDRFTQLIERLTIPVTVLGIGAQSDVDYSLEQLDPLRRPVQRFMRSVLQRSPSVGVRGEFTGEFLRHLGFGDVDVIGCPSMFGHGADLAVRPPTADLHSGSRIALNAARWDGSAMDELVASHCRKYRNLVYIAQGTDDLELMLWGEAGGGARRDDGVPRHLAHPLFRENRVRFFVDASTWIDYLESFDFCFGSRIHGNVAALLAGTPAHVLVHDSRTREIAEYFDIPHTYMRSLTSSTDAGGLLNESDYGPLVHGHRSRFAVLLTFLERHGLEHIHARPASPVTFDERLASLSLPPPIEAITCVAPSEVASRLRWLRDRQERSEARLARRLARLTRLVEQRHPARWRRRARRVLRGWRRRR